MTAKLASKTSAESERLMLMGLPGTAKDVLTDTERVMASWMTA